MPGDLSPAEKVFGKPSVDNQKEERELIQTSQYPLRSMLRLLDFPNGFIIEGRKGAMRKIKDNLANSLRRASVREKLRAIGVVASKRTDLFPEAAPCVEHRVFKEAFSR
jgi:hypothetical protein